MKYLNDREVAERLSVSQATIWNWVRANEFPPPVKLGPKLSRWPESDLQEFLANLPRSPTHPGRPEKFKGIRPQRELKAEQRELAVKPPVWMKVPNRVRLEELERQQKELEQELGEDQSE